MRAALVKSDFLARKQNASHRDSDAQTLLPNEVQKKGEITIGSVTEDRIPQSGPTGREFTYVDISSIDRETKRIVAPKVLATAKAPSRARQVLQTGDVVISMTRPNLNAIALVPPELDGSIGSTGFHVLRAREIEPKFLFYAVQSPAFINSMCERVQGALYPAVRPRDIASFCLPNLFSDARREIVAEIEKQFTRLDAGMASLKRAQSALKRYRASVLKAACEGRLVPTETELAHKENRSYETGEQLVYRILKERREKWDGKGKYKEPSAPNFNSLPTLPGGWTYACVEQLGTFGEQAVMTGPFGTNLGREDFIAAGVPVVTISCLQEDRIEMNKADFVSEEKANELQRYRLRAGDLLFSRMASVGRAGIVGAALDSALFNYHIMRLRLDSRALLPDYYLAYVRGSSQVDKYLRDVNHGATRPGINTKQLLNMPVALPPSAEQQRIVAELERRLSVVQELEVLAGDNLRRSTRLRQSVLQRSFTAFA